jgi:glucosylglycerate synthase
MTDSISQDASSQEQAAARRTEITLTEETFLTDGFLRQLINVGEVDILVGVPTYNNAKTIGSVVQTIQGGILHWFPRERAVIISADGGSTDGTPELVTGVSIDDIRATSTPYALRTLHAISTQYAGTPASGVALRTILAAAELLRAKACVVVSPESSNLSPEWLSRLLYPIYRDGVDLVTPTYRRHKFEGLLISNLLYPMIRALYGVRIREPYSPEFSFSGRLGSQFLAQNVWKDATGGAGTELRLTLAAITGGYRTAETFLGDKEHVEGPPTDLVPALRETVGALFSALEPDFPFWSVAPGAKPSPAADAGDKVRLEPVTINRERIREMFSTGVSELESVFRSILSPSTLAELQRIASMAAADFQYPAELWVRTVYEFAASYQKSVIIRDHIIQAMAPLFRGRVLAFLMENSNASAEKVEKHVEDLCLEFERLKPYLLEMMKSRE